MLPKSITYIWNNMTVSKWWQKLNFLLSLSSNKSSESRRDWTDMLDKYTRMILKDCLMSQQIFPISIIVYQAHIRSVLLNLLCALTQSLGKTQQTLPLTSCGSLSLSFSLSCTSFVCSDISCMLAFGSSVKWTYPQRGVRSRPEHLQDVPLQLSAGTVKQQHPKDTPHVMFTTLSLQMDYILTAYEKLKTFWIVFLLTSNDKHIWDY